MEKEGEAANAQCQGRVPNCLASESRPRFDSAARRFAHVTPPRGTRDVTPRTRDVTPRTRDVTPRTRDVTPDVTPRPSATDSPSQLSRQLESRPQAGKAVQCAK